MPNVVGLSEADARGRAARRRTRRSRCASAPPTTRRRTARCSTSVRARAWRSTTGRSVIVIVGRFEAPAARPQPHAAGGVAVRVAVLARRPLGRARGVAGVRRGRARRPGAGAATSPSPWRSPATAAGRLDGEPLALEPGGGLLGCDVAFPALHGPYGEDGTVQGLLEALDGPLRRRGGDVLGGVHGQGAVQGPDGGRRRAAGRLRRHPRGRGPGQPGRPGAARVREARAAGLVGGHLEGVRRRARSTRRAGGRLRARPARDRGGDGRTGWRWSARCWATSSREASVPGRDRDRGRLVRLRGQVRARAGWSWWCPRGWPEDVLERVRSLAVEVFRAGRLRRDGAVRLLRRGPRGRGAACW